MKRYKRRNNKRRNNKRRKKEKGVRRDQYSI